MKKTAIAVFLILFLLGQIPEARARDDFQYWNMLQVRAQAAKSLTFRAQGEQWLTSDVSRASLNNVDAGFLWRPLRFFEAGPFYRYQHVDNLSGPNTSENRYYLEASLRGRIQNYELSNRGRVEHRRFSTSSFWAYRNEVRATYHFKIKDLPATFYLSDEIFFREDRKGVVENRAAVGHQIRFHENFGLTVFYLTRHTKSKSNWKSDQVFGTTWTFYF